MNPKTSTGKMSKAGKEILAALMDIKQALVDGVPLKKRFTVRLRRGPGTQKEPR